MILHPRRAAVTWLASSVLCLLACGVCTWKLPAFFQGIREIPNFIQQFQLYFDLLHFAMVVVPLTAGISAALACLAAAWTTWHQPTKPVAARMHAYPLFALALGGCTSTLTVLSLVAYVAVGSRGLLW